MANTTRPKESIISATKVDLLKMSRYPFLCLKGKPNDVSSWPQKVVAENVSIFFPFGKLLTVFLSVVYSA